MHELRYIGGPLDGLVKKVSIQYVSYLVSKPPQGYLCEFHGSLNGGLHTYWSQEKIQHPCIPCTIMMYFLSTMTKAQVDKTRANKK